jgi:hypothetical protein
LNYDDNNGGDPGQDTDHEAYNVENFSNVGIALSLFVVARRPGRVNLQQYNPIEMEKY